MLQLLFAGILVEMMDEILQNGYGFGSAISLFISLNICEGVLWKSFSPLTLKKSDNSSEFEGAVIAFFHFLITKTNKLSAVTEAFFRDSAPNLSSVLATVLIFLIVIYFEGFKVNINLQSTKTKAQTRPYPIKLFYTSNMPIILLSALVSNIYFLSQILYKNFKGSFLVHLIGKWYESPNGSYPVGGLVFYLSPPRNMADLFRDPIHSVVYIALVLTICSLFSKTWVDVSGESPKDVAKTLKDQDMTILGMRDESNKKTLYKYIPIAASFGGLCIGLLSIVADLMGAIGSGTGILLAVTIIYKFAETFEKEREKMI
jgi:protein transport protein SEC61 subunit alpha